MTVVRVSGFFNTVRRAVVLVGLVGVLTFIALPSVGTPPSASHVGEVSLGVAVGHAAMLEVNAGSEELVASDWRVRGAGSGDGQVLSDGVDGSGWICGSPGTTFCDVPVTHEAYFAIEALYQEGLIQGCYSEGPNRWFCPDNNILRGDAMRLLARWLYDYPANIPSYLPPATGVFPDQTGQLEIPRSNELLYRDGIIISFPDGTIRFYEPMTRSQAMRMVMKALLRHAPPVPDGSVQPIDTSDPYILHGLQLGIADGYSDGSFVPYEYVTRADIAQWNCHAFLDDCPASGELETLRDRARLPRLTDAVCFSASASAYIPGLIVERDGMDACYNFISQTYERKVENGGNPPPHEYRVSPSNREVCQEGGIISLKVSATEYGVQLIVGKCSETAFELSGSFTVLVDGQRVGSPVIYPPHVMTILHQIQPLSHWDISGAHTYQIDLRSADEQEIPKYSGTVRIWEVYPPVSPDYEYDRSPDGAICGPEGIVAINATPENTSHRLQVKLEKCDATPFVEDGFFYIDWNQRPLWGPFYYRAGISSMTVYVDPAGEGVGDTGTVQMRVLSADQPELPKHTGEVNVWVDYVDICYPVIVSSNPVGTGEVHWSSEGACAGGTVAENSTVTLTADGAPFQEFDHWSGDVTGSQNPHTLNASQGLTATAHFVEVPRPTTPDVLYVPMVVFFPQ